MNHESAITQIERYKRLAELSTRVSSTLDLSALLFEIVEAAASLCEAEAASILLYDALKGELHFEAATNMDSPLMRGFIVPVDSSIAGWIVTNRQPIIITDAQRDERLFDAVGDTINMSTKSLLGVPLLFKDKVIGVLEAINKEAGDFSRDDLEILAALGSQAAVAIENSRLFQQSDLIAELVHELRTPMASLNTAAHLLGKKELSEPQRERFIGMIRKETNRLAEMTTTFLDLSRLESGRTQFKAEPTNVETLLEECVELMNNRAAEKNITLAIHSPKGVPEIRADHDKLKQVFLNLISNAIKYNYENGRVDITLSITPEYLRAEVQDTGPGISEEARLNLFQRFYRVPGTEKLASGTGLGLSIVKRIVEAHRGEIRVESEVGSGTTFIVHLPLLSTR